MKKYSVTVDENGYTQIDGETYRLVSTVATQRLLYALRTNQDEFKTIIDKIVEKPLFITLKPSV